MRMLFLESMKASSHVALKRRGFSQASIEGLVPLQLYLDLVREHKQLALEKDTKIERKTQEHMQLAREKDAKIEEQVAKIEELAREKDAKIEELAREKDAKIEEKDAKIEEKDAKIERKTQEHMQLAREKDAKIEMLYEENKRLLTSKHKLEVYKTRALIDAERVELRSILEHVLRIDGFGTGESDIRTLLAAHEAIVEACKHEPKIAADLAAPVTATALAKKLHTTWKRVCSDLHPQLSPADWRLRHPGEDIKLRATKDTQSDALLLYHLFRNFDYPVQVEDIVPFDRAAYRNV